MKRFMSNAAYASKNILNNRLSHLERSTLNLLSKLGHDVTMQIKANRNSLIVVAELNPFIDNIRERICLYATKINGGFCQSHKCFIFVFACE